MSRTVVSLMLVGLATLTGCGWRRPALTTCEMPMPARPAAVPEYLPSSSARIQRPTVAPESVQVQRQEVPPQVVASVEPPVQTKPRPQTQTIEIAQDLPNVPPVPWDKNIERAAKTQKNEDKAAVLSSMTPTALKPARVADPENGDIIGALHHLATRDPKTAPHTPTARPATKDPFQELTGHLTQWRKTWRLRYAAVNVEDPFGGSVMLDNLPDASKLRDGQHVRVRGRLVTPESRNDAPRYLVQSIELLD